MLEQESNEDSMSFLPAPPLGSDFQPDDATFDLNIAGARGPRIMETSSFQFSEHERIAGSTSTVTNPGRQLLGGVFDRGSALMSTTTASTDSRINPGVFPRDQYRNLNDSTVDYTAFADPLLHFDATNWLLDENFVDIGIGQLTRNDPPTDRSNPRPQPLPSIKESNNPPAVLDLRHMWYVQTRRTVDGLYHDYEGTGRQIVNSLRDIDEIYRTNMVEELRAPLRNEPLPSIDFLNLCIHLFFTRFNVALPLIHGPTFRPSENNILLVLTMCSAGAMTMTTGMATRIASMLFERVHKAGNGDSWERGLTERPHLTRDNIKGATIGQTFALLSGEPAHRAIADGHHGCLISLGRHVKLFTEIPELDLSDMVSAEDLERVWKRWARYEEMKRAAVVLHIHDAEIAALFHHEPTFRHNASRLPVVAPAELFQAPTAAIWAMKYRAYQKSRQDQREPQSDHPRFGPVARVQVQNARAGAGVDEDSCRPSMLNSWAALSGIGATICECRHLDLLSSRRITELETDLVTWYISTKNCCRIQECRTLKQPELPFCLKPLWHYTCMTMAADLDLLELAVGREGTDIAASKLDQVRAWISSPESKRCLLHALCLQNLVTSTTVDSAVAIHTARILFSAALCWYCYMLYLPWCTASFDSGASLLLDDTSDYLMALPEIRLLRDERSPWKQSPNILDKAISDLKRILGANPAKMKVSTLCVLESTLRRLGTSGISQKFADLIQAFVTGGTQ
ncbi:uncharacterized protein Z518_04596 [Rhinocladiella mackenziei CBS 650.93]|uniref:Transcription factor domain-containing protein n=1 Tax=Rhinocladiella mackenziei CBS 650.93 TaxID=1442369 RepID=A0A0D2JBZ6_9EURO|nr:uncharacterized protein Z518_04596 [Rhinocladiella mackenziei CBS 650.93]KIX06620.1 hypothetical protein Z518_04596 [Rhinocladiella mackenziei CBS 650.93]